MKDSSSLSRQELLPDSVPVIQEVRAVADLRWPVVMLSPEGP